MGLGLGRYLPGGAYSTLTLTLTLTKVRREVAAAVPQVTEVLVHFDTTRQQTVQLDLVDAAAAANPNPLQPLALHEAVTEPHSATDGASSAATGGSPPYAAPASEARPSPSPSPRPSTSPSPA